MLTEKQIIAGIKQRLFDINKDKQLLVATLEADINKGNLLEINRLVDSINVRASQIMIRSSILEMAKPFSLEATDFNSM